MFWRTLRRRRDCVALASDRDSLVLDINWKADRYKTVNLQSLLASDI